LPAALPQPGRVLRDRRQPPARRLRGRLPAAALSCGRRLHPTRRYHHHGHLPLRAVPLISSPNFPWGLEIAPPTRESSLSPRARVSVSVPPPWPAEPLSWLTRQASPNRTR